ncbi:hypothetical protein [Stutzerimonas xanthomarina]|uniref:hypothetical protein n=1 Tax=Stutzerimonas xanthomarina TaxID=271420 RepID=UPI003AA80EA1
MAELRRTQARPFDLTQTVSLEELERVRRRRAERWTLSSSRSIADLSTGHFCSSRSTARSIGCMVSRCVRGGTEVRHAASAGS